jgi:hypothetical protein
MRPGTKIPPVALTARSAYVINGDDRGRIFFKDGIQDF